jgi:glycosyltransferase involved in cell wall biosynthesis
VTAPLSVAIVIPALDEEASLPGVLAALPRAGAGWAVREVVVADNGSTDRTAEVARASGATVVAAPRRGYGSACLAAAAHLRRDPPDVIAWIDADVSDDPADLGEVLAPIVRGAASLVVGSRVLGAREPGSLTPVQAFGNRLSTWLMALAWPGARFTDLGPFRAMRWRDYERLGMRDPDFGWTVEMQARALSARLATAEVPVRYRRRRGGRSKIAGTMRGSFAAGVKILYTIARVRAGR